MHRVYQGTRNDCKFMSVDAAQFCLCRSPTNCLLSMNKSARRCLLCNESVKHDKRSNATKLSLVCLEIKMKDTNPNNHNPKLYMIWSKRGRDIRP